MTKRDMVKEYEAAGFTRDEYGIARRLIKSGMSHSEVVAKVSEVKYISITAATKLVDMVRLHLCCEA